MKGDFSRNTFDARRRYSGVRMQQGRVQLDADWNEQVDIVRHRTETGTADLIGRCGAPLHDDAFRIVLDPADLGPELAGAFTARYPGYPHGPGDFILTAGRFYVDGILCESDHAVPFLLQDDLPGAALDPDADPEADPAAGSYVVYLDVWQRHVTALEAPGLRETALGGPDTATRTRTIWQVRSLSAGGGGVGCEDDVAAFDDATAPGTGRLRARAAVEETAPDPCIIAPSAGYRGLENQLYRVEVHDAGDAYDLTAAPSVFTVTAADPNARTVTVSTGSWNTMVGRPVELFYDGPGEDPTQGTLAWIVETDGRTLTLNTAFGAIDLARQPRLRRVEATWKWSRDNGIVVTGVESIDQNEITVRDLGRDEVLGFAPGQWAEIVDEGRELSGEPGVLLRIDQVEREKRLITLVTPPDPWPGDLAAGAPDFPAMLRLRRWDGAGAVKTNESGGEGWLDVEAGVQVAFEDGSYRSGDHWTIAARTATSEEHSGNVEWPSDEAGDPALLAPRGIHHHHCRLAVVEWDGTAVASVEDCRCLFAPLSEINALEYVSGAGQEAMPDLTDATVMPALGQPLVVGVANGHCHEGGEVRFTVVEGGGDLGAAEGAFTGTPITVPVGADGLARCWWRLDGTTQHQLVEARLLEEGIGVHLPILFNASLSVAHEVAYDPRECATMAGQLTVQSAVDHVVDLVRLHPAGGQGQEGMPGAQLEPLRVLVASTCGPVAGTAEAVEFEVVTGGGTLDGGGSSVMAATDGDGIATVTWTLDATTPYQEVEARLLEAAGPAAEPTRVRFGATLSTADEVAFDASLCLERRGGIFGGVETVQEAIDALCGEVGAGGGRCCDRRTFVPALTQTLPGLQYRDGRNYGFEHGIVPFALTNPGIVFDGGAVWSGGQNAVMRVPFDATTPDQREVVPTEFPTLAGTWDGRRVWFTAPISGQVDGNGNLELIDRLVRVDPLDMSVEVFEPGGELPMGIAFDGRFVWVANMQSNTLALIDPEDGSVVAMHGTEGRPTSLAFDGEFMWAGVERSGGDGALVRVRGPEGPPEVALEVDGSVPWQLAFDGSHMWCTTRSPENTSPFVFPRKTVQEWGDIVKVDVLGREPRPTRIVDLPNCHGLVFDGRHMWILDQEAPRALVHKVDVDTAQPRGSVEARNAVFTGAYDGRHLWYSTVVQRADGTLATGLQRRLVG